jgi:hypothetical protein
VPAQSPIQCLQGSFLGERQAGRAVRHSPPSSAEVKNKRSHTSTRVHLHDKEDSHCLIHAQRCNSCHYHH